MKKIRRIFTKNYEEFFHRQIGIFSLFFLSYFALKIKIFSIIARDHLLKKSHLRLCGLNFLWKCRKPLLLKFTFSQICPVFHPFPAFPTSCAPEPGRFWSRGFEKITLVAFSSDKLSIFQPCLRFFSFYDQIFFPKKRLKKDDTCL